MLEEGRLDRQTERRKNPDFFTEFKGMHLSVRKEREKRMSGIIDRSRELRMDQTVHYNCAQGVLIPFAEKKGMTVNQARGLAANFGSGMCMGEVCGAITGGLMALGLYGADQEADTKEFLTRMKNMHEGRVRCKELLAQEVRSREQKKPHCDNMVFEAVEIVEDMLQARGLL